MSESNLEQQRTGLDRFALNGVDMRDHWTPNAEYFAAIRKSDTLAAIEAVKPEADAKALGKMKRPELANAAAEQLAGTGWLPPTLRPAVAE